MGFPLGTSAAMSCGLAHPAPHLIHLDTSITLYMPVVTVFVVAFDQLGLHIKLLLPYTVFHLLLLIIYSCLKYVLCIHLKPSNRVRTFNHRTFGRLRRRQKESCCVYSCFSIGPPSFLLIQILFLSQPLHLEAFLQHSLTAVLPQTGRLGLPVSECVLTSPCCMKDIFTECGKLE